MNPEYVDAGEVEECMYCYAGGCLDYSRKEYLGQHKDWDRYDHYCKLNVKTPENSPYCESSPDLYRSSGWRARAEFKDHRPVSFKRLYGRDWLGYELEYNDRGQPTVKKDRKGTVMAEWEYDDQGRFIRVKYNKDYVPLPRPVREKITPPPAGPSPAAKPHSFWDER